MKIIEAETVGMSSERLNHIDAYLERETADGRMPGIVAVAQRSGKVVYHGVHGLADIEAKKPIQADSLFRIYSMTKPIVSVALMTLHDEGRFQLQDPVAKYIPEIANMQVFSHISRGVAKYVPQDLPMTVFHLLTHMSGLVYGGENHHVDRIYLNANPDVRDPRRDITLEDMAKRLGDLPLKFQPGSNWQYSIATDVCGYLIQVISGMPLADFLEERIFKPLGMVDTGFDVPAEKVDRLAQIYRSEGLYDPKPVPPEHLGIGDVTTPTVNPSGGGGLVSTASDYLNFATMLINGGTYEGTRIIGPKTLQRMTTNSVPMAYLPLDLGIERYGYGFGLGFRVMIDVGQANGSSSIGEYGWSGYANTHLVVDPQEDLVTVMMTQYIPSESHAPRSIFPNLVYQAIDELG